MYRCPKCGNSDVRYLEKRNGEVYCRRCITFKQEENSSCISNDLCPISHNSQILQLDYPLTKEQDNISLQLLSSFKAHQNSLVKAVCGAGKTEIVFRSIEYALVHHLHVGFAVPRRNVVIDLESRFKKAFPSIKITSLYGGHTSDQSGDLYLLTTHQLYRFNTYFDLLILDEVDAFPFYHNEVLYSFLKRSVRGKMIILSATAPKDIMEEFKIKNQNIFTLDVRFHHQPIPVPCSIVKPTIILFYKLIKELGKLIKEDKQVFIFVPTIDEGKRLYTFISIFIKNGKFVCSQTKDNIKIIEEFGRHKYKYLVTTSILERGVTFSNLQVIIWNANHSIYTSEMIIQISGRVGRKAKHPDGEILMLATIESNAMKEAIYGIRKSNQSLQNVL